MRPLQYSKFGRPGRKVMQTPDVTLHDVLNHLAKGTDFQTLQDSEVTLQDDIQIYARVDSLTGGLYRQYASAKNQHEKLIQENGVDDPMTEIAGEVMESAKSALDTRIIELKKEQNIISEVNRIQILDEERQRDIIVKQKQQTAMNIFYRAQALENIYQSRRGIDDILLYMMLFVFLGVGPFKYIQPMASRYFNRQAA